jgi:hypothetical protein
VYFTPFLIVDSNYDVVFRTYTVRRKTGSQRGCCIKLYVISVLQFIYVFFYYLIFSFALLNVVLLGPVPTFLTLVKGPIHSKLNCAV